MQAFLSNGGLSKMLWIILTFLLGLGSVIILFYEIVSNQPINPIVFGIIGSISAHLFTIGGSLNTASQLDKKHGEDVVALAQANANATNNATSN